VLISPLSSDFINRLVIAARLRTDINPGDSSWL
jgi:hypothetical protein